MPKVLENDGFLFKATHLRDYVFKHKLNNVSDKITELKKEMLNRGSTIMDIHHVSGDGVKETWGNLVLNKVDLIDTDLNNLDLISV
ncbi:hypothetical protein PanWU01x14_287220 [Parasponia andersonii]|uniref:Uncharacterized protein n=1 Tax=Parasponia andersonii TaxID=3476 RepID=A0A2P5AYY2_PARAD|nr:hypothetical protein PanWU01x14_287220 [Parasponia andersonii]